MFRAFPVLPSNHSPGTGYDINICRPAPRQHLPSRTRAAPCGSNRRRRPARPPACPSASATSRSAAEAEGALCLGAARGAQQAADQAERKGAAALVVAVAVLAVGAARLALALLALALALTLTAKRLRGAARRRGSEEGRAGQRETNQLRSGQAGWRQAGWRWLEPLRFALCCVC